MKKCECGCGELAPIAKKTNRRRGWKRGAPLRFVHGHSGRVLKRGPGRYRDGLHGYVFVLMPGHQRSDTRGYVREHIAFAQKALGAPLPAGAVIHHVNGDPADNRNANLVVCQNQSYHALLHRRTNALAACGHADWRRCWVCRTYDAPETLYVNGKHSYHTSCVVAYNRKRKLEEGNDDD